MNELSLEMIVFVGGLGILVVICVSIVFCKVVKSTPEAEKSAISRQLLAFVTTAVVVATVYVFGALGVMKENGIVAILSGIVGYVLGTGRHTLSRQDQSSD